MVNAPQTLFDTSVICAGRFVTSTSLSGIIIDFHEQIVNTHCRVSADANNDARFPPNPNAVVYVGAPPMLQSGTNPFGKEVRTLQGLIWGPSLIQEFGVGQS
jgi:hypothetical protein